MTNNKMAQRKIRTTNDLQNTTLKIKTLLKPGCELRCSGMSSNS